MKLTVDANVFFAGLIKSGLARRIIFHPDLDLNAPYFLLDEVRKYRSLLVSKSRLSSSDFDDLVSAMMAQIELVSESDLKPYVLPASKLVNDTKDWPYLACALCIGSDILSNDPHLHSQKRVAVHSIDSLARKLRLI